MLVTWKNIFTVEVQYIYSIICVQFRNLDSAKYFCQGFLMAVIILPPASRCGVRWLFSFGSRIWVCMLKPQCKTHWLRISVRRCGARGGIVGKKGDTVNIRKICIDTLIVSTLRSCAHFLALRCRVPYCLTLKLCIYIYFTHFDFIDLFAVDYTICL